MRETRSKAHTNGFLVIFPKRFFLLFAACVRQFGQTKKGQIQARGLSEREAVRNALIGFRYHVHHIDPAVWGEEGTSTDGVHLFCPNAPPRSLTRAYSLKSSRFSAFCIIPMKLQEGQRFSRNVKVMSAIYLSLWTPQLKAECSSSCHSNFT